MTSIKPRLTLKVVNNEPIKSTKLLARTKIQAANEEADDSMRSLGKEARPRTLLTLPQTQGFNKFATVDSRTKTYRPYFSASSVGAICSPPKNSDFNIKITPKIGDKTPPPLSPDQSMVMGRIKDTKINLNSQKWNGILKSESTAEIKFDMGSEGLKKSSFSPVVKFSKMGSSTDKVPSSLRQSSRNLNLNLWPYGKPLLTDHTDSQGKISKAGSTQQHGSIRMRKSSMHIHWNFSNRSVYGSPENVADVSNSRIDSTKEPLKILAKNTEFIEYMQQKPTMDTIQSIHSPVYRARRIFL